MTEYSAFTEHKPQHTHIQAPSDNMWKKMRQSCLENSGTWISPFLESNG